MALPLKTFSEDSLRILSDLIERERNRRVESPRQPRFDVPTSATYGYVAEVPACGIPAANLEADPPITGKANCEIHKLSKVGSLYKIVPAGFSQLVHNLHSEVVTGRFAYVERDQYGDFFVLGKSLTEGLVGTCGTGTGTGTSDDATNLGCGLSLGIVVITSIWRIGDHVYNFRIQKNYVNGKLCSLSIAEPTIYELCCDEVGTGTTGDDNTCLCTTLCLNNVFNEDMTSGNYSSSGAFTWSHADGSSISLSDVEGGLHWVLTGPSGEILWYSSETIDPSAITTCPWEATFLRLEDSTYPPFGYSISCAPCVDVGTGTGTSNESGCYKDSLCVAGTNPWSGNYDGVSSGPDVYWVHEDGGYYITLGTNETGGRYWGIYDSSLELLAYSEDMPSEYITICPWSASSWTHTTAGAEEATGPTYVEIGPCEIGTGTGTSEITSCDSCEALCVDLGGIDASANGNYEHTSDFLWTHESTGYTIRPTLHLDTGGAGGDTSWRWGIWQPSGGSIVLVAFGLSDIIDPVAPLFCPEDEIEWISADEATTVEDAVQCGECPPPGIPFIRVPAGYTDVIGFTSDNVDWSGLFVFSNNLGENYWSDPILYPGNTGEAKAIRARMTVGLFSLAVVFEYTDSATGVGTYNTRARVVPTAVITHPWDFSTPPVVTMDDWTHTAGPFTAEPSLELDGNQ